MQKRRHYKKQRILDRDDGKCQYCGHPTTGIDHIIPVSFKGDNSDENLVVCCNECNSLASNFLFKDFIAKKNYILDQRLKREKGFTDPLLFPSIDKAIKCRYRPCEEVFIPTKKDHYYHSDPCRKADWEDRIGRSARRMKKEIVALEKRVASLEQRESRTLGLLEDLIALTDSLVRGKGVGPREEE